MSKPVSALGGVSHAGLVAVDEIGPLGMITLRGDLGDKTLAKAVKALTGHAVPDRGTLLGDEKAGVCWMSPDELLLLQPHDEVSAGLDTLRSALAGTHHLAENVSDARAVFRLRGPAAREVLAKLCPVDLSPGAFGPGQFRRTRMAQVPAAFWMPDDESFQVICFRSVAQYVYDLLRTCADPEGGVGYFPAGASN